jgi:hypothetical protein
MSKATRIRRESARERIAAQRAAARRAEMRNRIFITGGSILGVLVIVIAFIVIKANSGTSSTSGGGATGTALPASVIKNVTSVPVSTLTAVGAGSGQTNKPKAINGPPLTKNGKPEVLYVGAEYCPFCAAERWALTGALSRFGTFAGLRGIHSAGGSEVYPNTPTLTYYKTSYTSKYLVFTPVEEQTVTHATLQTPTSAQQALVTKYDYPPYVSQQVAGAIPFIDMGNKYALLGGSSYIPSALAGKTWSQVAAALSDPSSPIAQAVDGAANNLTAAICKVTGNKPANVCTSPMIKTLQGQL